MPGGSDADAALIDREPSEGLPDGVPQLGDSPGHRSSEQALQLSEDLLDRIEVRLLGGGQARVTGGQLRFVVYLPFLNAVGQVHPDARGH